MLRRCYSDGMSKFRILTLVSLLLVVVAAGCSSSGQGAVDKVVSVTLTAVEPATSPTIEPPATRLPVTSTVAISASPQVVDIQEAPPLNPTNLVPTATPYATSTVPVPTATTYATSNVADSSSSTISKPNSSERLFQYEPIDRITFTSIRSQGLFSEDIQASFTEILTSEFMTLQEKKGISVAVYQNGKLWSRALGFASQKEAMETVTPVGVKSSSKTFLSALILIQIEDGLYELSDRISDLLSDHPGYQSLDRSKIPNVTVGQLLTMTSGISDASRGKQELFELMVSPSWQPWDTLALVKDLPKAPGTFEYSPIVNSYLLAMLAEHVSGKDLYSLYRTLLLDPISVQASLIPVVESPLGIAHPFAERSNYGGEGGFGDLTEIDLWKGYGFIETDGRLAWAGAGMVSTAENMARWAYELYSPRGSAVSRQVRSTLLESFMDETVTFAGSPQKYGFHVAQKEYELSDGAVLTSYGHPGGGSGTSSALIYFPELDLSISILANSEMDYQIGSCARSLKTSWSPFECITRGFLEAVTGLTGSPGIKETSGIQSGSPVISQENTQQIDPSNPPRIAVSNFVDLGPIIKISKLRSAYGHDYTIGDEEHDPAAKSCRSMKHYLDAYTYDQKSDQNFGVYDTKGNLRYYAPVNGQLRDILTNEFKSGQTEYQFTIMSQEYSSINFTFMHVELLEDLRSGASVEAGQHIGFVARPYGQAEIVTWVNLGKGKLKNISFFDVTTDEVFAEYQARGINTRSQMSISREERDANPVACYPDSEGGKFIPTGDELSFNLWQAGLDNWVFLSP